MAAPHLANHAQYFAAARKKMVEEQLRPRQITDPRVLECMSRIPREWFVPQNHIHQAYADRALGIDCEQTISQPFIVALMSQSLELYGEEKVLEVGTGSGYQSAVLADLASHVISIERHPELAELAARRLKALGYDNVEVMVGDGTLGYPEGAPFDRIIVTAGGPTVPTALFDQLAEKGLLVMPIGDTDTQVLQAIRKVRGEPVASDLSGCRFVKLIGQQGWEDEGPSPGEE